MSLLISNLQSLLDATYPNHFYCDEDYTALYDRPIRIRASDLAIDLVITITNDRIFLETFSEQLPQLSISAPILELLKSLLDKKYHSDSINLQGASELAMLLRSFILALHVDWESLAASVFGPGLAFAISSQLGYINHWSKECLTQTLSSSGRYIQEEIQLCPTEQELQYFYDGVDDLSDMLSRLNARVDLLGVD